jgi:hypothetical protein
MVMSVLISSTILITIPWDTRFICFCVHLISFCLKVSPTWAPAFSGFKGMPLRFKACHLQPLIATQSHSEPLRATGSHSEPLGATQSHSEPLRATQSHSEPLRATGSYSHGCLHANVLVFLSPIADLFVTAFSSRLILIHTCVLLVDFHSFCLCL